MEKGDSSFTSRIERLETKAREVRRRIVEMIYIAQSGHPGGSLSSADILTALYFDVMKIKPEDPHWPDRDRFVLSKGHACPAWYVCLAMKGYFDLKHLETLRKFESILQGHPVMKKTPGIDMSTGSLGHGASAALGIALEGRMMKKDFKVYAVLGDGELNEGLIWEAAMCAAKYRLENLIYVVDNNNLQIDGTTDEVMPLEPLADKWRSFGWHVVEIDGHNMAEVVLTLEEPKTGKGKPVCIIAATVKGKGVSFMEDKKDWHGKAPNKDEYEAAMVELREVTK